MKPYLIAAALCAAIFCGRAAAQDWGLIRPDDPKAGREEELKQQIAARDKQIAELQQRIADLERRLADARSASGPAVPASQPTAASPQPKAHKVLFVIDANTSNMEGLILGSPRAKDDVLTALEKLRPDQSFNILEQGVRGVVTMQPGVFLPATPENRRRAAEFMKTGMSGGADNIEAAMKSGLTLHPDVIFLASAGRVKDIDAALKVIRDSNTTKVPINATLKFTDGSTPAQRHFLWQLCKENGGACVDDKGNPADEPVVPATVVPPKVDPPASKPSIFNVN